MEKIHGEQNTKLLNKVRISITGFPFATGSCMAQQDSASSDRYSRDTTAESSWEAWDMFVADVGSRILCQFCWALLRQRSSLRHPHPKY